MSKVMRLLMVGLLCVFAAASVFGVDNVKEKASDLSWPKVTKVHKPWTRWWWMGSAVDKPNLTHLLERYSKAGIGGVEITPIYGVKGYEDYFIDYLSPKWMEMLEYTVSEAERMGMGVDIATGTGWPFGGPQVGAEDAAAKVIFRTFTLDVGTGPNEPVKCKGASLQALMAYSDKGGILDLTGKVDASGNLDWVASAGKWELYAVFQGGTGQQVKRAAPGGEGNVIDHFSYKALRNYLARFDKAFAGYRQGLVRAYFNDSYEVYGANWTDDLFEEFKARRGYDLRRQLPALLAKGPFSVVLRRMKSKEMAARVKCDYRETISDLLLERFTIPWVKWSHQKRSITRNQAHGSPGNLLDLYAAVDIPETEIYRQSRFNIPGLRVDPDLSKNQSKPDPLMFKFASSAAHLTGKRLVSSESFTWLGEHFKVALSQVKPELDQLLVSGINHTFYHGITYSPPDEPWPGWLFYASTNFGPSNSFWRELPELNGYIARCQSFLQSGRPDNDILLYFPIYDLWHNEDGMLYRFSVHNIDKWLYGSGFHRAAKTLWDRGYTFDYVSDRLLADVKVLSDRLQIGDVKYRAVVVPQCRFMRLGILERLLNLAKEGATIIVQGSLPRDVPGFGDLENRQELFRKTLAAIKPSDSEHSGVSEAIVGKGRFLIGENLERMLELAGVSREPIVDAGIEFIRRVYSQGHHYFLANLGKQRLDGWVQLSMDAKSAVIFDPLSFRRGLAAVRPVRSKPATSNGVRRREKAATEIYLQLQPGESCILRTFSSRKIEGPKWRYLHTSSEPLAPASPDASRGGGYEIKGTWRVTFIEGGPNLPAEFNTENLASWTKIGGPEARAFSGTARYTITFDKPPRRSPRFASQTKQAEQNGRADDWVLDLGRVCESARVRVNGRYVGGSHFATFCEMGPGALWSLPFQIPIGEFLRKGKNVLEVEVTNLMANRIADLDRRKVPWKRFYDINFVNIQYDKFDASDWPAMDSGLLGPVRLIPSTFVEYRHTR